MSTFGAFDPTETLAGISQWLPPFLQDQRWYADKHRPIARLSVADWAATPVDGEWLIHTLIRIDFTSGDPATYFVPFLVAPVCAIDSVPIHHAQDEKGRFAIFDALTQAPFHDWLLRTIREEEHLRFRMGVMHGLRDARWTSLEPNGLAKMAVFEQSNSSLLYGDELFAKVFRRIRPGVNPDVELGRFFTAQTTFDDVPAFFGSIDYAVSGQTSTVALVQEQVLEPTDCWSLIIATLSSQNLETRSLSAELGRVTARMHSALASRPDTPSFAPEPIDRQTIDRWKTSFDASASRVIDALGEQIDFLEGDAKVVATSVLLEEDSLRALSQGFDSLLGYPKLRVHGDYHLGQMLRTPAGRFYVVDFEGEPQRPISERTAKTSPLKDVAGMLRSFSYARAASSPHGMEDLTDALIKWEQLQRESFIEAYASLLNHQYPPLVPEDRDALWTALNAWEVDKALYEVMYELSSRPEWLWLPLSALHAHI